MAEFCRNLAVLLRYEGEINAADLHNRYEKRFRKAVPRDPNEKLKVFLQYVERLEACELEDRHEGGMQNAATLIVKPIGNLTAPRGMVPDTEDVMFRRLPRLLRAQRTREINATNIKHAYECMYNRSLPPRAPGERLKAQLLRAQTAGFCVLDERHDSGPQHPPNIYVMAPGMLPKGRRVGVRIVGGGGSASGGGGGGGSSSVAAGATAGAGAAAGAVSGGGGGAAGGAAYEVENESFHRNLSALLVSKGVAMNIGVVDAEYKKMFGKHLPRRGPDEKLKHLLKRAEAKNACVLETRYEHGPNHPPAIYISSPYAAAPQMGFYANPAYGMPMTLQGRPVYFQGGNPTAMLSVSPPPSSSSQEDEMPS